MDCSDDSREIEVLAQIDALEFLHQPRLLSEHCLRSGKRHDRSEYGLLAVVDVVTANESDGSTSFDENNVIMSSESDEA